MSHLSEPQTPVLQPAVQCGLPGVVIQDSLCIVEEHLKHLKGHLDAHLKSIDWQMAERQNLCKQAGAKEICYY